MKIQTMRRFRHAIAIPVFALLASSCGSAEEPDETPTIGGKSDGTLTAAQCEERFDTYEPCPELDLDTASVEELEQNTACLDEKAEDPVWQCCEREALRGASFCVEKVDASRQAMCESARESYQECALGESFQLGGCRSAFRTWDETGWECCTRLDTALCDGPAEPPAIEDMNDLAQQIVDADGWVHLSPLFEQLHPVDVIPGLLQDSLPLYHNPYASNWLAMDAITIDLSDPDAREQQQTQLDLFEIERRLPVQYAVTGFGERIKETMLQADAYITLWETTGGRIVLATHEYAPSTLGQNASGWLHGPTFILPEGSVCDALGSARKAAPELPALMLALDAAEGRPDDSCLSQHFDALPVDTPEVRELETYFASRYAFAGGDDSRINTVEAAYRLDTGAFRGTLLEMVEVPDEETRELFDEIETEYVPRRARLLVNEHREIVTKYDDTPCERDALDSGTPRCAMGIP